jgi:hypothetical protein
MVWHLLNVWIPDIFSRAGLGDLRSCWAWSSKSRSNQEPAAIIHSCLAVSKVVFQFSNMCQPTNWGCWPQLCWHVLTDQILLWKTGGSTHCLAGNMLRPWHLLPSSRTWMFTLDGHTVCCQLKKKTNHINTPDLGWYGWFSGSFNGPFLDVKHF